MHESFPCVAELGNEVVFCDCGAGEVGSRFDEGGEGAGCEGLQALEGCSRGIGDEGDEEGVVGCLGGGFMKDGEGIVVWFGGCELRRGEVVAEGVDEEDDGFGEDGGGPAGGVSTVYRGYNSGEIHWWIRAIAF